MRRDELVDGAWYLIKNIAGAAWWTAYYSASKDGFVGPEFCVSIYANPNYEWARINPEEIFNAVPLNPQDGGMGCYGSVRHSQRMSVERALDKMSEKERLIVFYKYCDCCGVKQDPENPECKCWNNE